jgi:hypothetical protein
MPVFGRLPFSRRAMLENSIASTGATALLGVISQINHFCYSGHLKSLRVLFSLLAGEKFEGLACKISGNFQCQAGIAFDSIGTVTNN